MFCPKAYLSQLPQPRLHQALLGGGLLFGLLLLSFNHGTLFFPDEFRYFVPLNVWDALWQGQWERVAGLLQSMLDRPLYYVLFLPALLVQTLVSGLSVQHDPVSGWATLNNNFWIPRLWQLLLLLLNSHLVFLIGRAFFKNDQAGCVTQLFFLLWLPNWIYSVHLLPVTGAETFLFWGLYRLLAMPKESGLERNKVILQAGMAWLAGILYYPGFAYTGLGFAGLILLQHTPKSQRWRDFSRFFLPALLWGVAVELLLEILFGVSYLDTLYTLVRSVNQGNFDGSFAWMMEYYRALSPYYLALVWLPTVLPTLFIPVYWVSSKFNRHAFRPVSYLLVGIAFTFLHLALALNAELLHNTVVYARLLPPLAILPLLIWAGIATGQMLFSPNQAKVSLVLITLILAWPLFGLMKIVYPRDAYEAAGLKPYSLFLHSSREPDDQVVPIQTPDGVVLLGHTVQTLAETPENKELTCPPPQLNQATPRYAVLNASFIYPLLPHAARMSPALTQGKRVMSFKHPYSYAPYRFEGLDAPARRWLADNELLMQVIQSPCAEEAPE